MGALEPPYLIIRTELNNGKVIPFLGSGASLNARTPENAAWRMRKDVVRDEMTSSSAPSKLKVAFTIS